MKRTVHKMFVLQGGALSVALIVVLVLVFNLRSNFVETQGRLESLQHRYQAFLERDTFPSEENVGVVLHNQALLNTYFNNISKRIRKAQVKPLSLEPAQFHQLLEETLEGKAGLRRKALSAQVRLPEKFAFGFDRYAAGALPDAKDIPQLVVQLKEVAALCEILFQARVAELIAIERHRFEDERLAAEQEAKSIRRKRSRRRGRATAASHAPPEVGKNLEHLLYDRDSYKISILTREDALWEALDAIVRSDVCMMITSLELETERIAFVGEQTGLRKPTFTSIGSIPRADRIVAGNERVSVVLEVDVYRMKRTSATSA